MKRFFLLFVALACLSFLAAPVEAKRFGGGSSLGKQRSLSPQQTQQAPAAAPMRPGGSRWAGPLAGLAIGVGLGALFASLGVSEGTGMLLLIVLAVFAIMFLVSALRRRAGPATQYAGAGAPFYKTAQMPPRPGGGAAGRRIPGDFPVEAFLRSAKDSFVRLQAANDRGDLGGIRAYVTPELLGEIAAQVRERGGASQHTEILSLHADLLDVVTEGGYAVASVRMTGQIRENHGQIEHFDEVWHVQKNLHDESAVWLLSGIQQVS